MLAVHQKIICTIMMIVTLCIVVTVVQGQLPQSKISPVTIPGYIGECPSEDSRQASHNLIRNATHDIIRSTPRPECGPGNWRRVFYLNATRSDQSCPGQ